MNRCGASGSRPLRRVPRTRGDEPHPPHGPPSGVDYAALPAAVALAGLEVGPGAFRCFRQMERVAAAALRERAERAR